jgi:hypothetical protein
MRTWLRGRLRVAALLLRRLVIAGHQVVRLAIRGAHVRLVMPPLNDAAAHGRVRNAARDGAVVAVAAAAARAARPVVRSRRVQVRAAALVDELHGAADLHAPIIPRRQLHDFDPQRLSDRHHAIQRRNLLLIRVVAREAHVLRHLAGVHQPVLAVPF